MLKARKSDNPGNAVGAQNGSLRTHIRKVTPPPRVSIRVAALLEAAYQLGWVHRAEIERDVRAGLIEPPPDDQKIDPTAFVRELLESRG